MASAALVDPVTHQPFQLLEPVVGREVVGKLVADGGLKPLAVFLDVNDREMSDLRRLIGPGRRDRRLPLLERRVGPEDAQGVYLDRNGAARAGGERRGEPGADGGAGPRSARCARQSPKRLLQKLPRPRPHRPH